MSITVNIYYTGKDDSAKKFAEEMVSSGLVDAVRAEEGNERYDPQTVLLIDRWRDQAALDVHHKTEMMQKIAALREKYHLKMRVERFVEEKK